MEATERELRSLISQYTADPTRNINPFSMRLQGTIDANVQGIFVNIYIYYKEAVDFVSSRSEECIPTKQYR